MFKIPSTLRETEGRHIGDDSFLFIAIRVNNKIWFRRVTFEQSDDQ